MRRGARQTAAKIKRGRERERREGKEKERAR